MSLQASRIVQIQAAQLELKVGGRPHTIRKASRTRGPRQDTHLMEDSTVHLGLPRAIAVHGIPFKKAKHVSHSSSHAANGHRDLCALLLGVPLDSTESHTL